MVHHTPPDRLNATFAALADPTRRAILARLSSGEASVTELAEPFAMSLPAVSKHLKVLERAGLISRGRDAQWRPCQLNAGPLREVAVRAADAIERGDAQSLADAVDRSADLLERLGSEVDIPIVTPALARLVAAARRVGAVAKPSGAGAGDCGIALAGSAAQAARVQAAWQEVGIVPLLVAIAPEGVTSG